MSHTLAPFLRLLAFVWLALGMTVPVSAWTVHDAAHGSAQIDIDTHHHHADDGSISVDAHEDGDALDGGHDHMPSILLGAFTLTGADLFLAQPAVICAIYPITPDPLIEHYGSGGLRRPPRLG